VRETPTNQRSGDPVEGPVRRASVRSCWPTSRRPAPCPRTARHIHPWFSRPGRVSVAVAAQPIEFGRADLGSDLEFPAPDWALIGIDELGGSGESAALEHLGRRVFLGEGVGGDGPRVGVRGARGLRLAGVSRSQTRPASGLTSLHGHASPPRRMRASADRTGPHSRAARRAWYTGPASSPGWLCAGQLTAERWNTRMDAAVISTAQPARTSRLRAASAVVLLMPQMSCRPTPPRLSTP